MGKLDKTQPIFELLQNRSLPENGKLVLPVSVFKRKFYIYKSIVLKYIPAINQHVYKVGLYELYYDHELYKLETQDEEFY